MIDEVLHADVAFGRRSTKTGARGDRVTGPVGDRGPWLARLAVSVEVPLTVTAARELVTAAALAQDTVLNAATVKVRWAEIDRFWRHLAHHDVALIAEVSDEVVDEYIKGVARRGLRWAEPAGSTQRNRRTAVRHVFEILRGVGFPVGDPTLDLTVVEDRTRRAVAVSDAVIARLQAAAPHELIASRRAVVLTLAEAGATNSEITRVTAADVDLVAGTVALPGGTHLDPRTNPLTDWGWTVLTDTLTNAGDNEVVGSVRLIPVGAASAAATVSNTLSALCQAAAVRPRVTVEGIRGWRARRLFVDSGSIETAARFLGTRSLDTAYQLIGNHWRVNG